MDETKPTTPPPSGPETPPSKTAETEQYLFYNVMPKSAPEGNIIKATVAVVDTSSSETGKNPSGIKLTKTWLYVLIGGGILLLGGLGYWYWYTYILNPYKGLNVLLNKPIAVHSTTTPTTNTGNVKDQVTTPTDWQTKYFGNESCKDMSICGDGADPDHDGLSNLQEFKGNTDPNNADSDGDGLSDGDEVNVFMSNPSQGHTANDPKYTDADFIKGAYDMKTNKAMSSDQIRAITLLMKKFGLHPPTLKTLGDVLINIYHFDGSVNATTTPASLINSTTTVSSNLATTSSPFSYGTVDSSATAKQKRDAQRTNTMQNIGVALLKYQKDNTTFPNTVVFTDMVTAIKPYNPVATNPIDPINKDPYLYTYAPEKNNNDFLLTFYSETQNQLIKITAADAQKDLTAAAASQNDEERKTALETLQSALQLYSNKNTAGNQSAVFPTQQKYKTALVPEFISSIPKDPVSGQDYEYQVAATFDTFTLKTVLQAPPTGSTGYLCNQEECRYY
jgi:hypothetical protein